MKTYHDYVLEDDFEGVSKAFVESSHKNNIPVEPDPTKAKHMIKNDLRDAIPPQLYAVISAITSVIESTTESKNKV